MILGRCVFEPSEKLSRHVTHRNAAFRVSTNTWEKGRLAACGEFTRLTNYKRFSTSSDSKVQGTARLRLKMGESLFSYLIFDEKQLDANSLLFHHEIETSSKGDNTANSKLWQINNKNSKYKNDTRTQHSLNSPSAFAVYTADEHYLL